MSEINTKREKAEEILEIGTEYYESGELKEALKYFRKSIRKDPTYGDGYYHIGLVYLEQGSIKKAKEMYLEAINLNEQELKNMKIHKDAWWGDVDTRPYMRAKHALGLLYRDEGEYDKAIETFLHLLRLNPNDNQGVRYIVGDLYHLKGDFDNAIKYYKRALNDPGVMYSYALTMFTLCNLKESVLWFRKAFFTNPYIIQLILCNEYRDLGIKTYCGIHEPEWAEDYYNGAVKKLWQNNFKVKQFMYKVWKDETVHKEMKDYKALCKMMEDSKAGTDERSELINQKYNFCSIKRLKQNLNEIYQRVANENR